LRYSIDTSAILDGWNRYYPPAIFPELWNKLDELIKKGELRATEVVLHELEKKDDDVYKWVKDRSTLFIQIDVEIQQIVSDILREYPKLVDTRKNRSPADPFVIALAQINKITVVTGEHPTNKMNRPNIPDICNVLGIPYISLLYLMKEQGWVFKG